MILKRARTLDTKNDNITKHIYRNGKHHYILGVYTMDTAKFYHCDQNGKRIYRKTLSLIAL